MNWLRTLPYVRAWQERYRERGLVVVGAHAPEFSFEHDLDNVRHAVADAGHRLSGRDRQRVRDLALVRQSLLAGACTSSTMSGRVRFTHFGEEAYEETERAIQKLLGMVEDLVDVDAGGLSRRADWGRCARRRPTSARARRGSGRSARQSGVEPVGAERRVDRRRGVRRARRRGRLDHVPLRGPRREPRARRRRAGRGSRCGSTANRPGDDGGVDVDEAGDGVVDEPRMYQLVRSARPGPRADGGDHLRRPGPCVRLHVRLSGRDRLLV